MKKVILIVLDSVGVGALPDAPKFGDEGADTLLHISKEIKDFNLPNLCAMGLGEISDIGGRSVKLKGAYGKMAAASPNKDTTTGHWEMCGLPLDFKFPTYPDGFPEKIIKKFEEEIGRKTIGNYPMSGTEILKQLGKEHLNTGSPIVYTSADSVFQIAVHNDIMSPEELYDICRKARNILKGKDSVSRVIARPFTGSPGNFKRNEAARKDFSVEPPGDTLPDKIKKAGISAVGIGKIGDIFAHRGLTEEIKTTNNSDGIDKTIKAIKDNKGRPGLIFVNLVEFDSVYGHRRNTKGYADALMEFDRRLKEIIESMDSDEILMITADHGCDPTFKRHTDHTREYVPILVAGDKVKEDVNLGIRETFADCGQTIADILGIEKLKSGVSFKEDIL
ncbi:MAG: phosphopentomutase [Elusimicrobia bacterium]|nr:phosphopentomutase [Elusimicrobiota bacterium]